MYSTSKQDSSDSELVDAINLNSRRQGSRHGADMVQMNKAATSSKAKKTRIANSFKSMKKEVVSSSKATKKKAVSSSKAVMKKRAVSSSKAAEKEGVSSSKAVMKKRGISSSKAETKGTVPSSSLCLAWHLKCFACGREVFNEIDGRDFATKSVCAQCF